jgi:DNA-binding MurR/RpiR family transcriptional regulator
MPQPARRRPAAQEPAAHTPQTLLAHVRALTPNLAPAEQRVAAAAAADPAGVAAMTISELAEACRTSGTTVIRFCRALGLPGYPELRLALAAAAQAEREAGWEDIGSDIGPGDTLGEVIKKISHADARAVEETGAQLSAPGLEAVVDAVVRARRIDIYGVGASAFVALDLQQKLHRIERMAYAWPDPHVAVTSAALLRRGDVAIGISHTGVTSDTVASLAEARRQQAHRGGLPVRRGGAAQLPADAAGAGAYLHGGAGPPLTARRAQADAGLPLTGRRTPAAKAATVAAHRRYTTVAIPGITGIIAY